MAAPHRSSSMHPLIHLTIVAVPSGSGRHLHLGAPQHLQPLRHLLHRRPLVPGRAQALRGELREPLEHVHGRLVVDRREVTVEHAPELAPAERGEEHGGQGTLAAGAVVVDRLLPGGELHEDDAEAVDVALVGEVAVDEALRVEVAEGALHELDELALAHRPQRRRAEVGDLGVEPVVEQDVEGLHVAVQDRARRRGVQVRQRLRGLRRDLETEAK
uniref:Uncharacterized protein n=1 Tax=Oryza brachyantha TaxID=4533 RepID=J3L8I7_ORYBR